MTFRVNYNTTTGEIISYQEGGSAEDNVIPEGGATLSFGEFVHGLLNIHGRVMMKVDVEAKQLVLINPTTPPQPITED